MKFTTSKYIETLLENDYQNQLKIMKKEIKNTPISRKYNAKAFVTKTPRVFLVNGDNISLKLNKEIYPILDNSGKTYETDHDFEEEINKFLEGILEYTITFYFQTCLHYCGQTESVYQARIKRSDGEILEISDEDKLDIVCC